jgi:REP element-mobilizing transposase RayT
VDGGSYFFTVNTFRRQPFLADADVRAALRAGIATIRAEHPFVIEAWVLLPDHMHALWTLPPDDHDFSTRWRVLKQRSLDGTEWHPGGRAWSVPRIASGLQTKSNHRTLAQGETL